jgi:hypothetical protein
MFARIDVLGTENGYEVTLAVKAEQVWLLSASGKSKQGALENLDRKLERLTSYERLERENQRLRARCASLVRQVKGMATNLGA